MTGSLEVRFAALEKNDTCRLCRVGNQCMKFRTQASIGDGGSEIGIQATAGMFPTVAAPDVIFPRPGPVEKFSSPSCKKCKSDMYLKSRVVRGGSK